MHDTYIHVCLPLYYKLIHTFIKHHYVSTKCQIDTALGSGNIAENKIENVFILIRLVFLEGRAVSYLY